MSTLSIEQFSQLIAALYHGPLETQHWQSFLRLLRKQCQAKAAVLMLRRTLKDDLGVFFVSGMKVSPEDNRRFSIEMANLDPFVNLPEGRAVLLDEMIPLAELKKTEFYQRNLVPSDFVKMLGLDIHSGERERLFIRIARGENDPPFSDKDKQLCDLLAPHLRQLLPLIDQIQRLESERSIYEGAMNRLSMGSILLNQKQKIVKCNPIAEHLLAEKNGLRAINNHLQIDNYANNQQLQKLLLNSCKNESLGSWQAKAITVSRKNDKPPLSLVIRPIARTEMGDEHSEARTSIFISAPEMRRLTQHNTLQQLFNFTPKETSLVIALANGMNLDAIADDLCISRNTAKTHLHGAFQKTGVNQQSGLVSLVLRTADELS